MAPIPSSLWEDDTLNGASGWTDGNADFLAATFTVDFVHRQLAHAVARLEGEPEYEEAQRVQEDQAEWKDRIEERISELPSILRSRKE